MHPCPICEKRPPKRYCPARGEKICAICCGEQREVTIDCPGDCSYLVAAHRYEAEHRKPPAREELPYPSVDFSIEFVYERWPILAGMAGAIVRFQAQQKEVHDAEVYTALERLAEAYRTLETGIYYERPPEAPLPLALYAEVSRFLQEFRQAEAGQRGFSSLKDADVFRLLVFLLRMNKAETNGRPKSRAFLEFLRAGFPAGAAGRAEQAEAPRIILP